MVHSKAATSFIHFDGNWSLDEQGLIEHALSTGGAADELWIPEHEQELFLDEPWVCVKREGANGKVYFFASRFRMRHVFRAGTAEELVYAIEQGTDQHDPLCRESYAYAPAAYTRAA